MMEVWLPLGRWMRLRRPANRSATRRALSLPSERIQMGVWTLAMILAAGREAFAGGPQRFAAPAPGVDTIPCYAPQ